ncbi:MAG: hypothetical protein CMJ78_24525, partial [Planctomycetaceae bacterium]|nr:hypothetical protein [Planctomycetaceae bacterium]
MLLNHWLAILKHRVMKSSKNSLRRQVRRPKRLRQIEALEDRTLLAAPTPVSVSALDGTNGITFAGKAESYSGFSVAGTDDINGDGIDDFIVGAYGFGDGAYRGEEGRGESYLIFGGTNLPATINASTLGNAGVTITGLEDYDTFGRSVSAAGDIDGDGINDVVIGAPNAGPGDASDPYSVDLGAGQAYTIFGDGGLGGTLNLSSLGGNTGSTFTGQDQYDGAYQFVTGGGDFNGDGIDDIAVGMRDASPQGANSAGITYVIFGSNGGPGAAIGASDLNGNNGVRINGISSSDHAGQSVSFIGDINGDNRDDLLIGAKDASANGTAYVVYGSSSLGADFSLSSLSASTGFTITGLASGDELGTATGGGVDINGDDRSDFIIGAPGANDNAGASYVIFGQASSSFGSSFNLGSLNGDNGFRIDGITGGAISGADRSGLGVHLAQDVSGDGLGDIIVGSPGDRNTNTVEGSAHVVFGTDDFNSTLALSSIDGTNGFVIDGVDAGDQLGLSIGSADVNNDAIHDVIVGAFGVEGGTNTGNTFVVYGGNFNGSNSFSVSQPQQTQAAVEVQVQRQIDPTTLHVFDGNDASADSNDVTLVGNTQGNIRGSVVYDEATGEFIFVKSGDPLPPDTYTFTIKSGPNGVFDTQGDQLDGDGDGNPGGDFVMQFTITDNGERVLSVPDFARGAGQAIDIGGTGGIPVSIDEANGVTSAQFTFNFDPTELTVTGATALAPGWSVTQQDISTPGQITVTASGSALSAGSANLVALTSSVPNSTLYGDAQRLSFSNISINGGTIDTIGDDAIQKAIYPADANGNRAYDITDAIFLARTAFNIDGGFDSSPITDPTIVGDADASNTLTITDAIQTARKAFTLSSSLPDIPPGVTPDFNVGPDPQLNIQFKDDMGATLTSVRPGDFFNVEIRSDNAADTLEAVSSTVFSVGYDGATFEGIQFTRGPVLNNLGVIVVEDPNPAANNDMGTDVSNATYSEFGTNPVPANTLGVVLTLRLQVEAGATDGNFTIDLRNINQAPGVVGNTTFSTFDGSMIFPISGPNGDAMNPIVENTISVVTNFAPTIMNTTANTAINDDQTGTPFSNVTFADGDGDNITVEVMLDDAAKGVIEVGATGFVDQGGGRYTLTSMSTANAQTAIQGLVFNPTDNRAALTASETTTLTITIDDGKNNGMVSDATTMVVSTNATNDAPTINGTGNVNVDDNATVNAFAGVTLADPDPGTLLDVTIVQDVTANGSFTAGSLGGFSDNGSGTLTLNDVTVAAANTALQGLVFDPTENQVAVGNNVMTGFTITINDNVGTDVMDAGSQVTATSVNDPTVIAGTVPNQMVNDNATVSPFQGVTFTDPDVGESIGVTVRLSDSANGVFTAASLTAAGFQDDGNGVYSLTTNTDPASAQAAIRQLVFDPTENQVAPDATVTTTFTIDVDDSGASAVDASDNVTTVVATSINDASTINGAANVMVDDNATTNPFAGVTITDVDTGEMVTVSIQLNAGDANGTFTTLGNFTKDGGTAGKYDLAATTPADATTQIQALVFTPTENQVAPGNTVVTNANISVNDGDVTVQDNATNITATSINDNPVANDDVATVLDGNTVTTLTNGDDSLLDNDTDVDVDDDTFTVVSINDGGTVTNLGGAQQTITLNSGNMLTINPDGTFSYTDVAGGANNTEMLQYTISDENGGMGTGNFTIAITNPPTAVPDAFAVTEDTTFMGNVRDGSLSAGNQADFDQDGDDFNVTAIDATSAAGAIVTGVTALGATNGGFTYDPTGVAAFQALDDTESMMDTFMYTLTDENGATGIGTVTATVNGVNDAPIAVDDAASTNEDNSVTVAADGVLGNDTDVDIENLMVNAINGQAADVGMTITLGSGATVMLNADGSFTYDPNDSF